MLFRAEEIFCPSFWRVFFCCCQSETYAPRTHVPTFCKQAKRLPAAKEASLQVALNKAQLGSLLKGFSDLSEVTGILKKRNITVHNKGAMWPTISLENQPYAICPIPHQNRFKNTIAGIPKRGSPPYGMTNQATKETSFYDGDPIGFFPHLRLLNDMKYVAEKYHLHIDVPDYFLVPYGEPKGASFCDRYVVAIPKDHVQQGDFQNNMSLSIENLKQMPGNVQETLGRELVKIIRKTGAILSLEDLFFKNEEDRNKGFSYAKLLPNFCGNYHTTSVSYWQRGKIRGSLEASIRISLGNLIQTLKFHERNGCFYNILQVLEKAHEKAIAQLKKIPWRFLLLTILTLGMYLLYTFVRALIKTIAIHIRYRALRKMLPAIQKDDYRKDPAMVKQANKIIQNYFSSIAGISEIPEDDA